MVRKDLVAHRLDRPDDPDVLLAMLKDVAAWNVERRVFLIVAREAQELRLRDAVDEATDIGPVLGTGTHHAWLAGSVKRVIP
eukprot:CAMPEP_0119416280 /NCGR_PEP_ID=MMETSP1335-20130426/12281_1 /TAXON_ID=259385 /ORGANISM="Chrysoculter rhomboideus, Strain RCC1486" /LENGTH=81 /DNA_ID=CAMNT_0007441391 /DNA_START=59 /DNA_END=304 /DNA_ORIENTATION=-